MNFNFDKEIDFNQISLTGLRAIVLIGLLSVAPRSIAEIQQKFIEYGIMDESQSNDIIRIDLSTVKSFGCEILRSSMKTNFKYVLTKHPFTINITMDDVKIFKHLFDKIKNSISIYKLLECDSLLHKISLYICDEEVKEAFLGISPLKYYNIDSIKELLAACINNYTVKLQYKKSYSCSLSEKDIVAQKLVFKNGKLYLYGYDLQKNDSVTLLFSRITSIESKQLTDKKYVQNRLVIKFRLKDCDSDILMPEESILSGNEKDCIIEGSYFNEFLAVQRILSLGSACTVIEPFEFRNKIISKLKEMRKIYEKKH